MNPIVITLITLFFLSLIVRPVEKKTRMGSVLHTVFELVLLGVFLYLNWRLAIATWLITRLLASLVGIACYQLAREPFKVRYREGALALFAGLLFFLPQAWTWPLIGIALAGNLAVFIWIRSEKFRSVVAVTATVAFCALAAFATFGGALHLRLH